jgi:hypothetical protein
MFKNLCLILAASLLVYAGTARAESSSGKILGMYIHQHWAYNHPYSARTWSLADWKAYLGGLSQLGYNTVLIWPMLETIPDPPTPSDEEMLTKISAVIGYAEEQLNLRVYLTLCPNVAAHNDEALKYTFENRSFFRTEKLIDPGDPMAMEVMLAWRARLLRPLANASGVYIIDSDPGGWPNSTNADFVQLIGAHRKLLDGLRPGMEIVYWTHTGWENYSRYYAEGTLSGAAKPAEIQDAIVRLATAHHEPWGIAGSRYEDDIVEIATSAGEADRVITFKYGAIEREPAFPFTLFDSDRVRKMGRDVGPKGILGNAQNHCVQLPNTFQFSRAAMGLETTRSDYVDFAEGLIPGHGELIVESWEALQGNDAERMHRLAAALVAVKREELKDGRFAGLMFHDPARFITDLALQLRAMASIRIFVAATKETEDLKPPLLELIVSFEAWQQAHGYTGNPRSGGSLAGPLEELLSSLKKLNVKSLDQFLDSRDVTKTPGNTAAERVNNQFRLLEIYTARLIEEMKKAAAEL